MSNELIKQSLPDVPETVADVDALDLPKMTDDETKENLKSLGLTYIPANRMADFAKLGIHFKGIGVMKMQTGIAVSGQMILHHAMTILGEKLSNKKISMKNAVLLSKTLGYSLSKLTESQKFVASTEPAGFASKPDEPKQKSFPAGAVIINTGGGKVDIIEKPVANPPATT